MAWETFAIVGLAVIIPIIIIIIFVIPGPSNGNGSQPQLPSCESIANPDLLPSVDSFRCCLVGGNTLFAYDENQQTLVGATSVDFKQACLSFCNDFNPNTNQCEDDNSMQFDRCISLTNPAADCSGLAKPTYKFRDKLLYTQSKTTVEQLNQICPASEFPPERCLGLYESFYT